MKLSIKGLAMASGIIWGAAMLFMGLANMVWPSYGIAFLEVISSVYPGYVPGGFGATIIGTLYAAVDGAIGGAIFAWVYNLFAD